jgi:selenium-binding protein 1
MQRRKFLTVAATAALTPMFAGKRAFSESDSQAACCARTYASPCEAMQAPRETLAYLPALYSGTGVNKPDYLATVDLDPKSANYSRVIHRLELPHVGDELHHFGWNACSSCHADSTQSRRFLILPGLRSSRIYIVDTAEPGRPKLHKTIEPEEIARRTQLSAPHTVHCRGDGLVMISMLGDSRGEAPGGFLLLDQDFEIVGRWEKSLEGMHYNYDFWYQPRLNVMVSSEWAAPNTFVPGFKPEDVQAGKYGQRLYFWDWQERRIAQTIDMGDDGRIPLEVRFHHNPDSSHGFAGAALSSAIWHWHRADDKWRAEKVVQIEPVEVKGQSTPVPGLITDIVLSLDDRWLYLACWLHGDVRQYDVSDPARPKLTGRAWLGGNLRKGARIRGKELAGGPQMLQLSLDGKRLYVSNSLFSSWDNQFYPNIAKQGSYLVQIDCDTDRGGLALNEDFHVDFGQEPHGPARAHEIRFPGGDSTSDIWV